MYFFYISERNSILRSFSQLGFLFRVGCCIKEPVLTTLRTTPIKCRLFLPSMVDSSISELSAECSTTPEISCRFVILGEYSWQHKDFLNSHTLVKLETNSETWSNSSTDSDTHLLWISTATATFTS